MTYWTALVNNLFIFTKEFLIPLDPVAFLFFVFFSSSDFLGYYQVWRKVLIKQPNSYLFNCYKFPFYATIKYEWSETKKNPNFFQNYISDVKFIIFRTQLQGLLFHSVGIFFTLEVQCEWRNVYLYLSLLEQRYICSTKSFFPYFFRTSKQCILLKKAFYVTQKLSNFFQVLSLLQLNK